MSINLSPSRHLSVYLSGLERQKYIRILLLPSKGLKALPPGQIDSVDKCLVKVLGLSKPITSRTSCLSIKYQVSHEELIRAPYLQSVCKLVPCLSYLLPQLCCVTTTKHGWHAALNIIALISGVANWMALLTLPGLSHVSHMSVTVSAITQQARPGRFSWQYSQQVNKWKTQRFLRLGNGMLSLLLHLLAKTIHKSRFKGNRLSFH